MFKDKNLFAIFTIILQAIIIVLFNQSIFMYENTEYLKRFLPILNLIVLVLTGFVLFSIKEIGQDIKKRLEINLLKSHLKDVESLINTQQVQRHEHVKHIQTIQSMLYLGEIDSAKKYINGIAEGYWHMGDIIKTSDPALTALLNSKRKVANTKKIDFDFAIKCELLDMKITSWDLCSVIGNLLDNAFEAVIGNKSNRRVGLEIKYEDNEHRIYVFNNGPKISDKQMEKLFKPGYTTKGSDARGYGLFAVKNLVEKYKGKINVLSKERTVFIVSFPYNGGGINND